jgi:hypothetical protein
MLFVNQIIHGGQRVQPGGFMLENSVFWVVFPEKLPEGCQGLAGC